MKIIIYSFLLLIGLSELNAAITPVQINDYFQISENGTKISDLELKILNIVDEFTKRMCHEIPKFALPVLDPFKHSSLELDNIIPNFEIIRLANIDVKGLSDIKIENLKVSTILLKFTGQIKLDSLNLKTYYRIKGKIADLFEIDGEGQLRLDVGFNVNFDIRLGINPDTKKLLIKIPKLEPKLIINAFKITGLFPDDDLNRLIENIVNEAGHELFDKIWEDNKNVAIELLQMLATIPVEHLTVKELLDLIGSSEPIFNDDDPKPDCKKNISKT